MSPSRQDHSEISKLLLKCALDVESQSSGRKSRSPYKEKLPTKASPKADVRSILRASLIKLADEEDMRRNQKDFDKLLGYFEKELRKAGKTQSHDKSLLLDEIERARDDAALARDELRKAKAKNKKLKEKMRLLDMESDRVIRKLQDELSSSRRRMIDMEDEVRLLRMKLAKKEEQIEDEERYSYYRDQMEKMRSQKEEELTNRSKQQTVYQATQRDKVEETISIKNQRWDEVSALSVVDVPKKLLIKGKPSYAQLKSIHDTRDDDDSESLGYSRQTRESVSFSVGTEQRSTASPLPMEKHDRLSRKLEALYVNNT
jgi:chromosome segregation ATPase